MKTELLLITPKMARDMLMRNDNNRPLRPNVVDGFMTAYQNGEWKVTHQGIAFDKDGNVIDGQHRLTFISQLPEGTQIAINVTRDLDNEAFDAIDIGFRRTMSDVYGVSQDLVSVARFFARIANSSKTTGLTNQYTKPYLDWVLPEFEELVTFCPTHRRVWSSAAVRAAAVYQMKRGHDVDFVKMAYQGLVMQDLDAMPYAARALANQHMSGKIASARSLDLFCRAIRAFDSKSNWKIKSIIVKDMSATISDVRDFTLVEMKKSPVIAGLKVAKPSAKFNWNRAA